LYAPELTNSDIRGILLHPSAARTNSHPESVS